MNDAYTVEKETERFLLMRLDGLDGLWLWNKCAEKRAPFGESGVAVYFTKKQKHLLIEAFPDEKKLEALFNAH